MPIWTGIFDILFPRNPSFIAAWSAVHQRSAGPDRDARPGSQRSLLVTRRVGDGSVLADDGSVAQLGRGVLVLPEDMVNGEVVGEQIVGDDAAVTAPPHGF